MEDKPNQSIFTGIKRAFGAGKREVSEEEIKTLVDDATELLPDEKRMITEILELDELNVSDVMTPRVDMIGVEDTETLRQALERMQGTGYSRLPVFHDDLDHIVGVVHCKDLVFALLEDRTDEPVAQFAHEPFFVPESKDLFPLLSEMQTNRQQMAIVVDEYGGTDGLITVEDIVEEIVGEIIDESDLENTLVTVLGPGEWLVDGRLPVDDACDLGWPVQPSEHYDTIAGWLMDAVDVVPQIGEHFDIEGYRFAVRYMRRRRIQSLQVTRLEEDPSATDALGDQLESE